MKGASLITIAALLTPVTPLVAMPSLHCVSPQRRAPSLYVSVGSGGGVDHVRIMHGRWQQDVTGFPGASPRIARGFMDQSGRLSVRMVGGDGRTPFASLDLPRAGPGVFRYRGRAWRVRCRWDQAD